MLAESVACVGGRYASNAQDKDSNVLVNAALLVVVTVKAQPQRYTAKVVPKKKKINHTYERVATKDKNR